MEIEREPIPIELHKPELEIAWRGLLYSVKAGFLTRDQAIVTLTDWDNGQPSSVFPKIEDRAGSSEAE